MTRIRVLEMIDSTFLGGGQINILSLVSSLDKSLFDVLVCSRAGGAFVQAVKDEGIRHIPIPITKRISRKISAEISKVLSDNKIDVLHTHGGVAGLYGRWAAKRNKIPVVVHTLHGIHYLHYRNFILKSVYVFLERWFSRFTDAVIFVCESDRNMAIKYALVPERKTLVIRNGVDLLRFEAPTARKNIPSDFVETLGLDLSKPVVGTVARLHRQKGLPYLLKAARLLLHDIPGIQFFIVGGGPWKDKLTKLNKALGLENVVHFLGERKEIPEILSLFDVVALPSLWEGLPYSLMEAGALGKPVVATDVDGVREIIFDGKTGRLVPAKDPGRLAQAIGELIEDRELALGLGATLKDDLQKRYTLSRMVEEVQNLYLRLFRQKTESQDI